MVKPTPLPSEGGSFVVDASGKVLEREGGTKMPDQAAERLAENEAPAKPADVASKPIEEKP